MIKFSRDSKNFPTGRRPDIQELLTPSQIKAEAVRLLTLGIQNEAWRILDWLSVGGVMSAAQLELRARSLRRYTKSRLVDRLPYPIQVTADEFGNSQLSYTNPDETQLYVLGPVGLEVIKDRHPYPPLGGSYLSYPLVRVMHDVILNEIVLRLIIYAESLGWETTWRGPNSARLVHPESKLEILEPDALLVFSKADQLRAFCLEFHHKEDKQTRAELKVKNYQAAYESGLWQAQWELETFPTVLPVFTEKIVGTGYLNTLRERRSDVTYLGKLLAGVLQNNLAEWANFATNEKSTILE
jgi:hypothetical protein